MSESFYLLLRDWNIIQNDAFFRRRSVSTRTYIITIKRYNATYIYIYIYIFMSYTYEKGHVNLVLAILTDVIVSYDVNWIGKQKMKLASINWIRSENATLLACNKFLVFVCILIECVLLHLESTLIKIAASNLWKFVLTGTILFLATRLHFMKRPFIFSFMSSCNIYLEA